MKEARLNLNIKKCHFGLETVNYFPNFSCRIAPIIESFRDEKDFIWRVAQEEAFRDIKNALASKLVIDHYNPNAKVTELNTEACAVGLAAILFQSNDDLSESHPVYAISRRTSNVPTSIRIIKS